MILRTKKIENITIFELEGLLDFESTQLFEATCLDWIDRSPERKFVFNMEKLKFVGSSGINQFIQALKGFHSKQNKIKLCHLSSEFRTLFKAFETSRHSFDIFDDEKKALDSFNPLLAPPEPLKKSAPRKKQMEQ
jgi:anti-anti-sigma factor